jgi:hypothetical protein
MTGAGKIRCKGGKNTAHKVVFIEFKAGKEA